MEPRHVRPLARALTALGVLAAAVPAGGQQIPSPYRFVETGQEAGPFVGLLSPGTGRFEIGPQEAVAWGVRYGVEVSGPFAIEGVGTVLPTTRDVVNPRRQEGDRIVDEAEATLAMVEARLRFTLTGRRTWNGIAPFVFLGGGLGFDAQGDQAEDQKLDEDDRFEFGTGFVGSLGGGARWMLAERLLLRGDAYITLWKLDVPEGFRDPDLDFGSVPQSEWVNAGTLTLGLAWRF